MNLQNLGAILESLQSLIKMVGGVAVDAKDKAVEVADEKLIEEWRSSYKAYSMIGMSAAVLVNVVYSNLPERFQNSLTDSDIRYITIAIIAAAIVGRLWKQNLKTTTETPVIEEVKPQE